MSKSISETLKSLGPAFIVASVVLGPGSILSNSYVGAQFGYSMIWLLVLASLMMILVTSLAAQIGLQSKVTPCQFITKVSFRGSGITLGIIVFGITLCFQFTNNLAIMTAFDLLLARDEMSVLNSSSSDNANGRGMLLMIVINLFLIISLYGSKKPYQMIERAMLFLVITMICGFALNFFLVTHDFWGIAKGILPNLAKDQEGKHLIQLLGMVATTFSIAGAFYQCYAVRERSWNANDWKKARRDTMTGIGVLGGISLLIMLTGASVLSGTGVGKSLPEISMMFNELLGPQSMRFFCIGILAAAFSSLFVNPLIGGTVLADGLGKDCRVSGNWTKAATSAGMLLGMVVAILGSMGKMETLPLILTAQAITVVGVPFIAWVMLKLIKEVNSGIPCSKLVGVAWLSLLVAIGLSVRTISTLFERFAS